MKFIIKVCDDLGYELSRHTVDAEPHFPPMNDLVYDAMVYFEFKPHYLAVTKDLYDKMLATRKEE